MITIKIRLPYECKLRITIMEIRSLLQNAYQLHFVESSHVNTIPKQEILNIEILYYNKKNIDMKKREMFPRC